MTQAGLPIGFGLLGPVLVVVDGQDRTPGRARLRELLALLLARPCAAVSSVALIAQLYGDRPPATAATALQVHVSQLRKVLAPGVGVGAPEQRLRTRPGAYQLCVEPDEVDVCRFESLAKEGEQELAAGRPERAASTLRQALALWRGEPAAGVAVPALSEVFAPWAQERRLTVLEQRIHADLAAGAGERLVGELQALVVTHGLRERLCGQLMLALYRSGRQADALTAFRAAGVRLAAALGCAPGAELRALHAQILAADPALDARPPVTATVRPSTRPDPVVGAAPVGAPAPSRPAPRRPVVAPAQVPAGGRLVGRDAPLRLLTDALREAEPGTCVIDGGPGTGTTGLALRTAHAVRDRFPDGQLFARLRGVGAEAVLGEFLVALGHSPDRVPAGLGERSRLFRDSVAGYRVLIVLDDVGSAQQVRMLHPGTPGSAVLATAPRPLVDLRAAGRTSLGPLAVPAAQELLAAGAGRARVHADPDATHDLLTRCGRLPLAVRIAAARLAARPHWSVRALVDRLARPGGLLAELVAGDLSLRASLLRRYQDCDAVERRAFRQLGGIDPATRAVPEWAVGALLGPSGSDTGAAAARGLVAAGLLVVGRVAGANGADSFRLPEPAAALAVELARQPERERVLRPPATLPHPAASVRRTPA